MLPHCLSVGSGINAMISLSLVAKLVVKNPVLTLSLQTYTEEILQRPYAYVNTVGVTRLLDYLQLCLNSASSSSHLQLIYYARIDLSLIISLSPFFNSNQHNNLCPPLTWISFVQYVFFLGCS